VLAPTMLTTHPNDGIMFTKLPGTHSGQEVLQLHHGPKEAKLLQHIGHVKLSGLVMNRM